MAYTVLCTVFHNTFIMYTQIAKEFELITEITGVNEKFRKAWLTEWARKIIVVAKIDGISSIHDDDDYNQADHDDLTDGTYIHHAL